MTPSGATLAGATLAAESLTALIGREGPVCVGRFMELCLHHPLWGYYATRPGLGPAGDFITAPLVSQMFGEVLGLWAASVWIALGRPAPFRLIELGPGHGVMMSDMLRAARIVPGFLAAREPWLVETSGPLRERQAGTLAETAASGTPPRWAARIEDVPGGAPLILLANEFLDCLPIAQAVRAPDGWRRRRVAGGPDGALAFTLGEAVTPPPDAVPAGARAGAVVEWSDAARTLGRTMGARVARDGGAALFIDYGRDQPEAGDTLQALRGHRKESPLAHPGEADLTAHVDFPGFLTAARAGGAEATSIRGQGVFLMDLGIAARAEALARSRPDLTGMIGRQLDRLVGPDQMGVLFKVAAVLSPGLHAPGFDAAPSFEIGPPFEIGR